MGELRVSGCFVRCLFGVKLGRSTYASGEVPTTWMVGFLRQPPVASSRRSIQMSYYMKFIKLIRSILGR